MIRKEILEYVKRELKDGYSEATIKKALLNKGWNEEEAEDTIKAAKEERQTKKDKSKKLEDVEYVGFWRRVGAAILDYLILLIPLSIFAYFFHPVFGALISGNFEQVVALMNSESTMATYQIANAIYSIVIVSLLILCEVKWGGTPGKLVLGYKIVNEDGHYMSVPQAILRMIGRLLSALPFYLGLLWIGWDDEKQGWHDKLAKTHVVKATSPSSSRND